MARKSRERIVFEARVQSLLEDARGSREEAEQRIKWAKDAEFEAEKLQVGLDEAENMPAAITGGQDPEDDDDDEDPES